MRTHLIWPALALFLFLHLGSLRAADTTPPAVFSITPLPGSTVSHLVQITIVFNEPVTGVTPGALQINGTDADSVSGANSTNFTFTFTQPLSGQVLLYVDIDQSITDLSGNYFDSVGFGSWLYTLLDTLPPSMIIIQPSPGATLTALSQVQIMFSEPVTNVDAADLLINGSALATNLSGSGAGPYRFQFPPQPNGMSSLAWADGHGIQDLAATPNPFAGGSWSYKVDASAAAGDVVINEFLASPVSTNGLVDEDGQFSDWIELYNRGAQSVDLNGWSLTVDPTIPAMWTFPTLVLAPGQYLVVFASGKDRKTTVSTNKLHTNFELTTPGQYLGLYTPDFVPHAASEFAPAYPEQRNDISYGYDSTNALKYFYTSTPGGPNGASAISDTAESVHFSIDSGFFNGPLNLILTTPTPGASIRYTTDFSEPTLNNGVDYSGPILISNKTTVIRAVAFQANVLPSLVETRRYFFVEDIVHQPANPPGYPTGNSWTGARSYYPMDQLVVTNAQYSNTVRSCLTEIPTISIVSSLDNLFGATNGIYTHTAADPVLYRGAGWERPCSAEFILPDGSIGFRIDCGVQIQGGSSRDATKCPKHSFRLNFKSAYSFAKLHYQIFPDSPVDTFNTFVLDLGINYWWHYNGSNVATDQRQRAQCVRDQFVSDLQNATGKPSFHGRFAHVYLNNLYWGICYIHERPDEDFAASYFGGDKSEYDVAKNTTFGYQQLAGDSGAYNTMIGIATAGLAGNAQYEKLQQYCDVDNLIDYMIANIWAGNDDWPQHNWYVIRRRQPGAGFKFITWDAEHVMKSATVDRTGVSDPGPAQVYNALRGNAEFRLRFADHLHKHFFNGGLFYTDPNPAKAIWDPARPERNRPAALYMQRIAEITNAIVAESARWGSFELTTNYSRNDQWLKELKALLGVTNATSYPYTWNYLPTRSSNVLQQFKAGGLYPAVPAPSLSQFGGRALAGYQLFMTNNASSGTIYYTTNGVDPRAYGSGAIAPGAHAYTNGAPVVLTVSAEVKARLLQTNGLWSALVDAEFNIGGLGLPLRITELMYNPIGGGCYEFLELQNIGATPVDLGNFSYSGINFTFPAGTIIDAGDRMVLASNNNTNKWKLRYPGINVAGWYGGKLSNNGERIALLDADLNTIISVDYSASSGWPAAANAGGFSLEIIDPNGDPDDPANWRASASLNGTPGLPNSAAPPPTVVLNEVMADNLTAVANAGAYPDWVELYNAGGSPVDLANWSLSQGPDARQHVFPANTLLAAGGYLVLWCDTNNAAPGLHSGFTLARTGGSLFLYDPNTNRVDAISFGSQVADYSLGRLGGVWQLTVPTPGATNAATALASPSNLTVNEWLANSPAGASDWLELFNRSSTAPAALRNTYVGTSNALFQIRSLSFIPPLGFIQLFADELPGPDHLDLKLHGGGDAIILSDETGGEINRVTFGPQLDNVSQGRLPDGSPTIITFPGTASPGASNYVALFNGPALNEVLAKNVSAITNGAGRVAGFVELYNPTSTDFSLAGQSLSVDQAQPGQWLFPAGAVISAQGYLVVWFDPGAPASMALEANLNAGLPIDADSGGVYLFNSASQLVDSVEFGFQVQDLPIGKVGEGWSLLSSATPGVPNSAPAALGSASGLRLNEWMASPLAGDGWFEIFNSNAAPVSLNGLHLTDDPSVAGQIKSAVAPLAFVAGNGFVTFKADGSPSKGRNHLNFKLDPLGGDLRIYDASLSLIDGVDFGLQVYGVSQGRLPDGAPAIVNFPASPTPGQSNYRQLPNALINEVLTQTRAPLENAIELFNPAPDPVSLDGWFLSDSADNFKKYQIPSGTTLAAGGFLVFYENQFNAINAAVPFTLNGAHGGQVWLSGADSAGHLTGYRAGANFDAAENGVSFGPQQTSLGTEFTALSAHTFGADNPATVEEFRTGAGRTNASPKIGPIVINEIMYHPPDIGTNDDTLDEYVELYNLSGNDVPMYDPAFPTNQWRLQGGIRYTFTNFTVPAGGYLLIVSFDPVANPVQLSAFRSRYGLSPSAPIYGPYTGKLANGGEALELVKPDSPQIDPQPEPGFVPYFRVDRVAYDNQAPWPSGADGYPVGAGLSLQRRAPEGYGNEPLNWLAAIPTPGTANGAAVTTLPVIAEQPQNTGGMAGAKARFSVTATGGAPLAYRWRFNGLDLFGATNSAVTIPYLQSGDEGGYTVFVSNPDGSVLSSTATLTVAPQPNITQQPRTQVAAAGTTVTFSVLATGDQLAYQWRFNGGDLPGATNSALTLTNVQTVNAGAYSVAVFNFYTPISSDLAYLVMTQPAITVQPQAQTNLAGATATLTVSASGDAPLGYQWRKNGTNVSGATSPALVLANVQPASAGDYSAVVSNPLGSATSSVARLTVIVPLQILQQPLNLVTNGGSNVVLTVTAIGTGTLLYQWSHDGTAITNNPTALTRSLFLTNVQLNDNGVYSVLITDDLTSLASSNATLTVKVKPFITQQPAGLILAAGGTANFTISATGSLPMTFRWRKLSTYLPNGTFITNGNTSSFTITNVQAADASAYNVAVTNIAGAPLAGLSSNAFLTVVTPPGNQTATAGSNVTFTVNASGVARILYRWQFNGSDLADATNASLTLNNVQTSDQGDYSVVVSVATNAFVPPATFTANLQVLPANHAPTLAAIPDLSADVLAPLRVTMSATDPDLPAQALRFSLGPGAPAGARVNPSRGTFSWTPSRAQAASTNIITAAVTDDGAPPLSDSRTFQVIVGDYVEISLGRAVVRAGDGSSVPITLGSSTPMTNANFAVDFSGQLSDWSVQAAGGAVVQAALQPGPGNRVFVAITAASPLPLGTQALAQLNFTLGSNQPSAFLALTPSQASAYRMDGSAVSRILFGPGRVVAVGDAPLLEAVMGSNQDHSVILYSPPDGTYAVERSSGLGLTANWVVKWQHTPGAGLSQTFLGGPCTNGTCFYRAR